jgi:hypothetical protein
VDPILVDLRSRVSAGSETRSERLVGRFGRVGHLDRIRALLGAGFPIRSLCVTAGLNLVIWSRLVQGFYGEIASANDDHRRGTSAGGYGSQRGICSSVSGTALSMVSPDSHRLSLSSVP